MGIEVDFKDFVEEHKIVLDKIYNVTVFTVDSYFGVTFSTGQENPPTFIWAIRTMMGAGLGPKNIQAWIWDGSS